MELHTARLFLRPFRAGDHAALHRIAGDPEVVRWMDWGPNTPEETAVFLEYAATCDPANLGSARVLEKIGMSREGLLRDHFLIRGAWRDRLMYARLAQLR